MRSLTKQEPGIPVVYCQRTNSNEALCSLMSSVFQRNVRSKRFDRNQRRETLVNTLSLGDAKIYVPQGPFRSKILIVVVVRDEQDRAFFDSAISIGTNRGHAVASIFMTSAGANPSKIRSAFMELLNQNRQSELYLCLSDEKCSATLSDAVEADGASHIGGWYIVGDKLPSITTNLLHNLAAPSLVVVTKHDPRLVEAANRNPFVLVVSIPGGNDALSATAQLRWTSRCLVDFCEAESARRRHGGRSILSKL